MSEFTLRNATPDDVCLYYEWATDPDVRHQSFAEGEIAYEDHVRWFARKIADSHSYLFVLVDNGTPVGQIRFAVDGDTAEMGYSVARESRGCGLGRVLVELGVAAVAERGVETIIAKVKPDNQPSIAVFLGCGFEEGQASDYRIFYKRQGVSGRRADESA